MIVLKVFFPSVAEEHLFFSSPSKRENVAKFISMILLYIPLKSSHDLILGFA